MRVLIWRSGDMRGSHWINEHFELDFEYHDQVQHFFTVIQEMLVH